MNLQISRDFGISITGQIDQSMWLSREKKIYLLGSPRGSSGPSQAILAPDCIQRTGLPTFDLPAKRLRCRYHLGPSLGWWAEIHSARLKGSNHWAWFSQGIIPRLVPVASVRSNLDRLDPQPPGHLNLGTLLWASVEQSTRSSLMKRLVMITIWISLAIFTAGRYKRMGIQLRVNPSRKSVQRVMGWMVTV
ncbi:MAG: hypothetical protein Ct9H300mP14_03230 [Gammaproteobacteria bacterium]|nr:MAG: hypothetical protein Ct9H300mP14_03230 [Gammaproteobacteria bacterium]